MRWLMQKNTGENGPRNDTGALWKAHDQNVAERFNDSK